MNVKRTVFNMVLMSLVILLSSSSFFLSHYLSKKIEDKTYTNEQFTYALKNKNITALKEAVLSAEEGTKQWLSYHNELAKTQADFALKLGIWYQNKVEGKKAEINQLSQMWLKQAIRLNSNEAMLALSEQYFQQKDINNALELLSLLLHILKDNNSKDNDLHIRSLILMTEIAIHQGKENIVINNVKEIKLIKTIPSTLKYKVEKFINDLSRYSIYHEPSRLSSKADSRVEVNRNKVFQDRDVCLSSLQLFASNLANLKHTEELIKEFKLKQPLAKFICLPEPKYLNPNSLHCSSSKSEAITCEEDDWQKIAEHVDTRYVGYLTEEGGANVHLGILYMDVQDDVDVFSHEVSHLLGFVDEYPVSKGHEKCQQKQTAAFSHNIAVLHKTYQGNREYARNEVLSHIPWRDEIHLTTPILQRIEDEKLEEERWVVGTPSNYSEEVGLYKSETCNNAIVHTDNKPSPRKNKNSFMAFKPVNKQTQLRYFSSEFPQEYINILTDRPEQFLMPSFHYNIALANFQKGRLARAKYWLNQAAGWETNITRKSLIKEGGF